MNRTEAIENVHKAINDLFGIRPGISTNEAKEALRQLREDIDLMLRLIDEMEAMGVPPDARLS